MQNCYRLNSWVKWSTVPSSLKRAWRSSAARSLLVLRTSVTYPVARIAAVPKNLRSQYFVPGRCCFLKCCWRFYDALSMVTEVHWSPPTLFSFPTANNQSKGDHTLFSITLWFGNLKDTSRYIRAKITEICRESIKMRMTHYIKYKRNHGSIKSMGFMSVNRTLYTTHQQKAINSKQISISLHQMNSFLSPESPNFEILSEIRKAIFFSVLASVGAQQ